MQRKSKPKHFRICFLCAIKGQSARAVAESLGVNVAQVHLANHRLARQLKEEVKRLEREKE